jgi:hypothetical protein
MEASMADELKVGQKVKAFSKRWTPEGWEPIEQVATVIDPCVSNDTDYAGDVELKIDGELSRVFVPRASVEPIADSLGEIAHAERVGYEERILAAEMVANKLKRLIRKPDLPGAYKGDMFYPVGGTEASHRWDGEAWRWLPDLDTGDNDQPETP